MPSNPQSFLSQVGATNHRVLLERRLKKHLAMHEGTVLVIGAGHDPYRSLLTQAEQIITNDIDTDLANIDIVSSADDIPLTDGSVEVIVAIEVFEHVEDLKTCIVECNRLLQPGGILYITMPFLFHIHGDPNDYRRLTRQGLEFELKPHFNIVSTGYYGNIMNVLLDSISSGSRLTRFLRPFFRLGTILDMPSEKFPSGIIVLAKKRSTGHE